MDKTLLFWSGGKDSALCLHALRGDDTVSVAGLVVTLTGDNRVGMHGVPAACVRAQADALGLPLVEVAMPAAPTNRAYLEAVRECLAAWKPQGVNSVAFGDLFLDDIRAWREREFEDMGYACRFPIWGRDTTALARDVVNLGYRATIVTVDTTQLDGAFCGRDLNHQFLRELPGSVDPSGEQGEYHTFVWDGPSFAKPVAFEVRGTRRENQFVFAEAACPCLT